ncbi:hypothetical protein INR49_013141 [Caranx melampygus]|nr:hypothetical protein INR49_013141 [Caranx melampygus]
MFQKTSADVEREYLVSRGDFTSRQDLLSALYHKWGQGVQGEARELCVVNGTNSVLSDWEERRERTICCSGACRSSGVRREGSRS